MCVYCTISMFFEIFLHSAGPFKTVLLPFDFFFKTKLILAFDANSAASLDYTFSYLTQPTVLKSHKYHNKQHFRQLHTFLDFFSLGSFDVLKFDLKHYQSEKEIRFQRKSTIGTHKTFSLSLITDLFLKYFNGVSHCWNYYFFSFNDLRIRSCTIELPTDLLK